MDVDDTVFVDSIIDVNHQLETTNSNEDTQLAHSHCNESNHSETQNDTAEKHSAVWTSNATSVLLKLYETKLEMLETPKRKKRIWLAISESLKDHNIDMSPDQVRWKINALTRKYKRCVDSGVYDKFKYFKVMDNIYSKYNIDGYEYTISEILDKTNDIHRNVPSTNVAMKIESKAVIDLRKIRLANRIESDRSQSKIHIERQWLEYLNRQERTRMQKDKIFDRIIQLKEQKLELRKREQKQKQSIGLQSIQLKEKDVNEILQVEREKFELLKQLFC